jgi:hypothetical protein
MKTNGKQRVLGKAARRSSQIAALLAMVLSFGAISRAQSSATTRSAQDAKPPAAPAVATRAIVTENAPASSVAKPAAKGAQEGIKVHGHWIIEVRNPDGSITARQEFDNALDPIVGADILTGLLSGEYVPGGFFVALYAPSGLCQPSAGGAPINGQTAASVCFLNDTRSIILPNVCTSPSSCGSLTYAPSPGSGATTPASGYTLAGTVQMPAGSGGTISSVATGNILCEATGSPTPSFARFSSALLGGATSPAACAAGGGPGATLATAPVYQLSQLTSHSISQPVSGGQTVAVTVQITFQ